MINQIAAGEVIERPASVVKELVENAIDSGASRIEIVTAAGGKSLIRVTDNGSGMGRQDLSLAVQRHCTSKLNENLHDIRTLGFRGEALPSIGAVARMQITSRSPAGETAWTITVDGGTVSGPKPAALSQGTIVEVADLFHATPARLKFLKTDRAEANAIADTLKRIVVAFPEIRFTLSAADRTPLDFPVHKDGDPRLGRIAQIFGPAFADNSLAIDAEREGVRLTGHAGLPTFNRGNALHQFVYVNGRPVRDKLLAGAIRGAYADFVAGNRHPVLALFIDIDPQQVDVNVHPAKADVRFRDPGLVRGLIVGALREAITAAGHRASTRNAADMMGAFRPQMSSGAPTYRPGGFGGSGSRDWRQSPDRPLDAGAGGFSEPAEPAFAGAGALSVDFRPHDEDAAAARALPLGAPRAQLHENYIVSQTRDGLVIVDQHAAHERLVYEAMKTALYAEPLAGQILLIPEIVELPEEDIDRLMEHADQLAPLGFAIERFGPGAVAVRETPAMLGTVDAAALVRDLVDEIAEWGAAETLKDRIDHVAATMACHGSVRSGRRLRGEEMDALLRQIEATPNSGQCNHGRPTYVELKLKDIERLFGRR